LVVQPIPTALTGGFAGLIDHSVPVNGGLGGSLRFQIARNGHVAGQLFSGNHAVAFPWQGRLLASLTGDPTFSGAIPGAGLSLAFTIQSSDATFAGMLTRGADAAALAGRHYLTAASTLAGTHNATLQLTGADLGDPTKPQGEGALRLKITPSGAITVAGHLGDGKPILFGTHFLDDLSFPLFLRLYSGHGSISGTPIFGTDGTLNGTLDWEKLSPISPTDPFPSFSITPELSGE
jgi:hypothetical protein